MLAKNESKLPQRSTGKKANDVQKPKQDPKNNSTLPTKKPAVKKGTPNKSDSNSPKTKNESTKFKGSPPSIPAAVSFEIRPTAYQRSIGTDSR